MRPSLSIICRRVLLASVAVVAGVITVSSVAAQGVLVEPSPGFVQPGQTLITGPSGQVIPPVANISQPQNSQFASQPLPPNYSAAPQTHVNIPWYQKLATKREHDFGVVPTASKQTHVFDFENTTGADIVLTNARTSCGCTKPTVLTTIVAPGKRAQVEAILDTLKFHGDRGATVTVSVKKMGQFVEAAELQFSVKGQIRRDVVLHPGDVRFESMLHGRASEVKVAVNYAGAPNWEIVDVRSTNPNICGVAKEISRDPATRITQYELVVSMTGDQAVGTFNDYLTIVTNDQKTTGMPVHVHGRVSQGIQVAPIRLGAVQQDERIAKRFIVKSDTPVQIASIECADPRVRLTSPTGSRSAHVISYELDTAAPGHVDARLTLHTDRSDQPTVDVPFRAEIVAARQANDRAIAAQ